MNERRKLSASFTLQRKSSDTFISTQQLRNNHRGSALTLRTVQKNTLRGLKTDNQQLIHYVSLAFDYYVTCWKVHNCFFAVQ